MDVARRAARPDRARGDPRDRAAHADWADGLVTVNQHPDRLRDVLAAYRDAGGRGTAALQVHVAWAPDPDEAMAVAREQWGVQVFGPPVAWDLDLPESFDSLAPHVSDEAVRRAVLVEHDPSRLRDRLAALVGLGFDAVYVHQVATDPRASDDKHPSADPTATPRSATLDRFLDMAGEHLLPGLREVAA